jgi:putative transposase
VVHGDNKYHNRQLRAWMKRQGVKYRIEIGNRPAGSTGFVVIRQRWVVERTLAWLGRYRRLSKDYEYYPESSEAWLKVSAIHGRLRRLKPDKTRSIPAFKYPKKAPKVA